MLVKVNVKDDKADVYCGRPSPLGNPYPVSMGRAECIDKYRRWLWAKIKGQDAGVTRALKSILQKERLMGSVRLGCHCAPLDCHVDAIIAALQNAQVLDVLGPISEDEAPGIDAKLFAIYMGMNDGTLAGELDYLTRLCERHPTPTDLIRLDTIREATLQRLDL